ncbi:MAG: FliH/SctL family protein [Gemmatimonadota bacterium]
MRSSSSALLRANVSQGAGDFARWTPEMLGSEHEGGSTPESVRKSTAEAIAAALAEAALQAGEREADLVREAESAREAAVEEAYERGYEKGREDGERGEAARLRNAVQAAQEALDELRAGELRWTGTIEENICALAAVIARQVLGRELALDIEPLAELVRSALLEFPIDQPIRIRINPSDLAALSSVDAIEADPLKRVVEDREARWFPDVSIAPGGCVVEGRERIIDGRIDTALERVYRRLTYTNA